MGGYKIRPSLFLFLKLGFLAVSLKKGQKSRLISVANLAIVGIKRQRKKFVV